MIHIYNQDCMEAMASMKDNEFDLAIVDPPYGIDISNSGTHFKEKYERKDWDTEIPTKEYFIELKRVSKNQIIWGANYFSYPFKKMIIWDKKIGDNDFSMAEIASHSFSSSTKICSFFCGANRNGKETTRIHPCQKPISLYTWLLDRYAQKGWKILDTHLGSGSSAIAAHNMGYEFHGYELDKEYYLAAKERLENHQRQLKLPLEI